MAPTASRHTSWSLNENSLKGERGPTGTAKLVDTRPSQRPAGRQRLQRQQCGQQIRRVLGRRAAGPRSVRDSSRLGDFGHPTPVGLSSELVQKPSMRLSTAPRELVAAACFTRSIHPVKTARLQIPPRGRTDARAT